MQMHSCITGALCIISDRVSGNLLNHCTYITHTGVFMLWGCLCIVGSVSYNQMLFVGGGPRMFKAKNVQIFTINIKQTKQCNHKL